MVYVGLEEFSSQCSLDLKPRVAVSWTMIELEVRVYRVMTLINKDAPLCSRDGMQIGASQRARMITGLSYCLLDRSGSVFLLGNQAAQFSAQALYLGKFLFDALEQRSLGFYTLVDQKSRRLSARPKDAGLDQLS